MKKWSLPQLNQEEIRNFADQLKLSPLVASLLYNRGITSLDQARDFLFADLKDLPNPFLLASMDVAVARILKAMDAGEKITVYGDYDVDGTVASSLLFLFFKEIGFPVHVYIPHRLKEGYSLNKQALQKLKNDGTKIVITVDNGIVAHQEALFCRDLNLDLIITDHHEASSQLPEALAVLNPKRSDCSFPAKQICGTGVAFFFVMALRQALREKGHFSNRPEPNLKKFLDLVALATVADVVPLTGVNRILVRNGLGQLRKTFWPGLRVLKVKAQVGEDADATSLGFRLGPRINAGGRLYDAMTGFRMLTASSEDEALPYADSLEKANAERRKIEQDILDQAISLVESNADYSKKLSLVLFHELWHPGVIGIVASRLVSKYSKPVILLGLDGPNLKGSARSFGGLSMVDLLRTCQEHLIKCGGHKAAAGLSLTKENLHSFVAAFEEAVKSRVSSDDLKPHLRVDAHLSLKEIHVQLLKELQLLEPYGEGNPQPVFVSTNNTIRSAKIVGTDHLKFDLQQEEARCRAMAFKMGKYHSSLGEKADVAYTLNLDTYFGDPQVVLHIKDIHSII
ncbi:MAG TPA: single-stranded-DNA-specific exonuclease RecJ [Deltaproteobacteria bacterium]|nr:MAG: single-stranded-DNA-specific exonuclease RecJ [Deltaproteobacteria bacterium GWA2_45_12]HBF12589.1 single-stranded-DNA-specific exonuclease RecJ [Deltaproteobacteria bacterium]